MLESNFQKMFLAFASHVSPYPSEAWQDHEGFLAIDQGGLTQVLWVNLYLRCSTGLE